MLRRKLAVTILAVAGLGTAADTKKVRSSALLSPCPTVTVQKFTIETNSATDDFPAGHDVLLQKNAVMRLKKSKLFDTVVDGESPSGPGGGCTLSGTVIRYDKGSRTARYLVGLGAGATKVMVRFAIRDASGAEIMQTDREGKFYGAISWVGGSNEQAVAEAAGDVIDGLIKDIEKKMPVAKAR